MPNLFTKMEQSQGNTGVNYQQIEMLKSYKIRTLWQIRNYLDPIEHREYMHALYQKDNSEISCKSEISDST